MRVRKQHYKHTRGKYTKIGLNNRSIVYEFWATLYMDRCLYSLSSRVCIMQ